jgi:hypothetical protein
MCIILALILIALIGFIIYCANEVAKNDDDDDDNYFGGPHGFRPIPV